MIVVHAIPPGSNFNSISWKSYQQWCEDIKAWCLHNINELDYRIIEQGLRDKLVIYFTHEQDATAFKLWVK